MKRHFTDKVLESVAEPLKKDASDTMRSIDNDCLYIGDLKDGMYSCAYMDDTLYAKGGYLFECVDRSAGAYNVIPTAMISVQPEGACGWGMASTFYRVFETEEKDVIAIESRDSEKLAEFLGLQFKGDLLEGISEQLHIPKAYW